MRDKMETLTTLEIEAYEKAIAKKDEEISKLKGLEEQLRCKTCVWWIRDDMEHENWGTCNRVMDIQFRTEKIHRSEFVVTNSICTDVRAHIYRDGVRRQSSWSVYLEKIDKKDGLFYRGDSIGRFENKIIALKNARRNLRQYLERRAISGTSPCRWNNR